MNRYKHDWQWLVKDDDGEWVKYADVEALEKQVAELEAENEKVTIKLNYQVSDLLKMNDISQAHIAELKEQLKDATAGLKAYNQLPDLKSFLKQMNSIKVAAIREMVYTKIESGEWHSLDIAAEQCLEHADKLEGE